MADYHPDKTYTSFTVNQGGYATSRPGPAGKNISNDPHVFRLSAPAQLKVQHRNSITSIVKEISWGLSSIAGVIANQVHHATITDVKNFAPEKLAHLQRGGIRNGVGRNALQTQQMLDKVPASQHAGLDAQSSAHQLKHYLADKDASHIVSYNHGGSGDPSNLKWENQSINRARGDHDMNYGDQIKLDATSVIDNVSGAVHLGLQAAPSGAVRGAIVAASLAALRNGLSLARNEVSVEEGVVETIVETAIGAAVGATAAFTVTAIAAACPPVAPVLMVAAPVLIVTGIVGWVSEVFNIFGNHYQRCLPQPHHRTYLQLSPTPDFTNQIDVEYEIVDETTPLYI